MGFIKMLPSYAKLLNKARCPVESPAGDLRDVNKATEFIYDRLKMWRKSRGYTLESVRQIVQAQADASVGKGIPLSPELQAKFDNLSKALSKEIKV